MSVALDRALDPPAPGLRADLEVRLRQSAEGIAIPIAGPPAVGGDLLLVPARAGPLAAAVLHAHVHGRLRLLLLAAELAAAGDAAAADRAVRGDPGPAGAGGDRRRGCPGAGRPDGGGGGCAAAGPASAGGLAGHGPGRCAGRGDVHRPGRRPAPLSRRQRDDLQPADRLHRDRDHEPAGRGPAARSGQPEQALDAADRRRLHAAGHAGPRRALGPGRRRRRLHRLPGCSWAAPPSASPPASPAATRAPPCCRACRSAG